MPNSRLLQSGLIVAGVVLVFLIGFYCTPNNNQIDRSILTLMDNSEPGNFQASYQIVLSDTIPQPWPPPKKVFFIKYDSRLMKEMGWQNGPVAIVDLKDTPSRVVGNYTVTTTRGAVSPDNKNGVLLTYKLEPGEKLFILKASPSKK